MWLRRRDARGAASPDAGVRGGRRRSLLALGLPWARDQGFENDGTAGTAGGGEGLEGEGVSVLEDGAFTVKIMEA